MSVFQNIIKFGGIYRSLNVARFSVSSCLNVQTIEEKLGLKPRPKKPSPPFIRFIKSIRPEILETQPDIKVTDLAKIASERWKKIDENQRSVLRKQYEIDLCKYQQDLKEYDLHLGPDNLDKILTAKENIKLRKDKFKQKKRREVLGCPRKPPSAFLLFVKEKLPTKDTSSKHQEFISRLGKEWRSFNDSQKKYYLDLHKKELQEYKEKLAKWENDMKNKDNSEVHPTPTESVETNNKNFTWKQMTKKLITYFKR